MQLHPAQLLFAGGAARAGLLSAGAGGAQASGVNVDKSRDGRIGVSASPILVIGGNEADESTTFGAIVGATRLPDRRILVGERSDYSLRVFSPYGKQLRGFGRKGSGPGEMPYLAQLYRCGNAIFADDIETGYRISVFSLDLTFQREFRFVAPDIGGPPYKTACNASQQFLQYGWEGRKQMKAGAFRTNVPFWYADATQKPGVKFCEFPGSERWGSVDGGQFRGTRPLPFGKEAIVAIGPQRGYVGTGETYEIMVFDLAGKRVGTIRDATPSASVTAADITLEIELQTANKDEETRKRVTAGYAAMKLPATMPAYSAFKVDEIGRDYVLGRFMDAEVAIPQVHLYKLTR